ncbi:hypothetical protein M0R45_001760 [Rubus argutus]|uniref:Uncharacterized protein n=1 Tax=Rubus argutus TaxID=59490 RepID=A0AAW1VLF8_RUBAR
MLRWAGGLEAGARARLGRELGLNTNGDEKGEQRRAGFVAELDAAEWRQSCDGWARQLHGGSEDRGDWARPWVFDFLIVIMGDGILCFRFCEIGAEKRRGNVVDG